MNKNDLIKVKDNNNILLYNLPLRDWDNVALKIIEDWLFFNSIIVGKATGIISGRNDENAGVSLIILRKRNIDGSDSEDFPDSSQEDIINKIEIFHERFGKEHQAYD